MPKNKHDIEKAAFDSVKPGDVFYLVTWGYIENIAAYRKLVVSKVNSVTFSFEGLAYKASRKRRRLLDKSISWDRKQLLPAVPHVMKLIKEFDTARERRIKRTSLEAGVPALLQTLMTKDVDKFDRFADELESILTKYRVKS